MSTKNDIENVDDTGAVISDDLEDIRVELHLPDGARWWLVTAVAPRPPIGQSWNFHGFGGRVAGVSEDDAGRPTAVVEFTTGTVPDAARLRDHLGFTDVEAESWED